jgi:uncharacterized protein
MDNARPSPNRVSPFVEGLARGVVRYQCCATCGSAQTLTRSACSGCGGLDLPWRDAAGTGTVYASTVVHRAPSEAWRALAPYTLVLVDLDEGPRVMAHGAAGLLIGERVQARIRLHAGRHLLTFEPGARR